VLLKIWQAELADEIYKALSAGENVVAIAPTSFGKTVTSPHVYMKLKDDGLVDNLIHVVPIMALIKEIYEKKFSYLSSRFRLGYQAHADIKSGLKSSYFLTDITVTTLDSFIWNIYRIPVAEFSKVLANLSQGHYYPIIASVITSLTVLDEAHMYLGEGFAPKTLPFIVATIKTLNKLKVPLVIESATLPSTYIETLVNNLSKNGVRIIYACSNRHSNSQVDKIRSLVGEDKLTLIDEYEDFSLENNIDWITKIVSREEALNVARDYCNSKRVLFIANTVDRAVSTYRELKDICSNSTLIHSRLIESDKHAAEREIEAIRKLGSGLIVATQVVEVGVEVNADVLITDAAPIDNLAQRAGRLCRDSKCDKAEVYIIKPKPEEDGSYKVYDEELVNTTLQEINDVMSKHLNIDWRLLHSRDGMLSYVELLERVYDGVKLEVSPSLLNIADEYLSGDARPYALINLLKDIDAAGLVRESYLVKVLVEGFDKDEGYFTSNVDVLSYLEKRKECLRREGEELKVVVIDSRNNFIYSSSRTLADVIKGKSKPTLNNLIKVRGDLIKNTVKNAAEKGLVGGVVDFYLLIKKECYKEGLGAYVE